MIARNSTIAAAVVAISILAGSASYSQEPRQVGDWIVGTSRSRIDDSTAAMAMRFSDNKEFALHILCIDRRLGLTVNLGNSAPISGGPFEIRYRIDKRRPEQSTWTVSGQALLPKTSDTDALVRDLVSSSSFVLETPSGREAFFDLARIKEAIVPVYKLCGLQLK